MGPRYVGTFSFLTYVCITTSYIYFYHIYIICILYVCEKMNHIQPILNNWIATAEKTHKLDSVYAYRYLLYVYNHKLPQNRIQLRLT